MKQFHANYLQKLTTFHFKTATRFLITYFLFTSLSATHFSPHQVLNTIYENNLKI